MMKIPTVLAITRNNKSPRNFKKLSSLATAKGDLVGSGANKGSLYDHDALDHFPEIIKTHLYQRDSYRSHFSSSVSGPLMRYFFAFMTSSTARPVSSYMATISQLPQLGGRALTM